MTEPKTKPWWKYGHVWMVIGGPLVVVVASFITLYLAMSRPDPVVSDRAGRSAGETSQAPEGTLAKAKNCMACHATDKKLVGPAYKDVAAKYAKDKGSVDLLAAKIMKGGSGVWGPVPMPANPQVNEAEAKKLATWVLTIK